MYMHSKTEEYVNPVLCPRQNRRKLYLQVIVTLSYL
jgi:hypothetical protein